MQIKKGFTLVELLVVVLIIGILSAIALPMYEKAVEKAQAVEAIGTLRVASEALKRYHLANGSYPTKFDELDIQMPGENIGAAGSYSDCNETQNWDFRIGFRGFLIAIRLKGKYKGATWGYASKESTIDRPREIYCEETTGHGFRAKRDSYCKEIFGGKRVGDTIVYTLP